MTSNIEKEYRRKSSDTIVNSFLGGAVASALAKTAVAPIERLRLLITYKQDGTSGMNIFSYGYRFYKEMGILQYWKGNGRNVLYACPNHALNFAFHTSFQEFFSSFSATTNSYALHVLTNIAAGSLAGILSVSLLYPIDYSRMILATERGPFKNIWEHMKHVSSTSPSGFLGLYPGYRHSIPGIAVYRGLYFGLFTTLSAANPHRFDDNVLGYLSHFVIAYSTVGVATTFANPFDVVRRRLIMHASSTKKMPEIGYVACLQQIWREEGLRSLFRGPHWSGRAIFPTLTLLLFDKWTAMAML